MFSLVSRPCELQCTNLAIGEDSQCKICQKVMCRDHYDDPIHTCGYSLIQTDCGRLQATLADLDEEAISRRVSYLRPMMPFKLSVPKTPEDAMELIGSFNLHVGVKFEDGVEWLVRISKYKKGDGPADLGRNNLESEALTIHHLRCHGIPVPTVHEPGVGDFSKTGNRLCRHIIYDKMPGLGATETEVALSDGTMSREDMTMFATDFAAMSVKLSQIPCEAIGSYARSKSGEIVWGPPLNGGYPENLEAPYFGGPFYTLRYRYIYRIDALIELIKKGLIYRLSPLLHYLAFMEARRLVMADPVMARRDSTFYFRHPDCSGANVLADGNRITGLVDWEWTATTTKAAAFAAPKWAYESEAYLDGDNSQTPEEDLLCEAYVRLGRPDLTECVRGGRRYHRLHDLLFHWQPYYGETQALGQLTSLTRACEGEDTTLPQTLAEWMDKAKDIHKGNPDLKIVIELDDQFRKLRHRRPENVACESIVPDLYKIMGWD